MITGATGFIGGAIARKLHHDGYSVTATGRNPAKLRALKNSGIAVRQGDLLDTPFVQRLCIKQNAVIHCAAKVAEYGTLKQFFPDTVSTTQNICLAARKSSVEQFLFLSSPSVLYGLFGGKNRKENDVYPNHCLPPYAHAKVLAEKIVKLESHHFESTFIFRPQAVFGPGELHFFPRLLKVSNQRGIPIQNNGSHLIDTTSIDTVVHAVAHCLMLSRKGLTVCNISNDDPRPFKALIQQIFSNCGEEPHFLKTHPLPLMTAAYFIEKGSRLRRKPPPITPSTLSKILYPRTLDVSFALDILGIHPPTSIDDTILHFSHWWRLNKDTILSDETIH